MDRLWCQSYTRRFFCPLVEAPGEGKIAPWVCLSRTAPQLSVLLDFSCLVPSCLHLVRYRTCRWRQTDEERMDLFWLYLDVSSPLVHSDSHVERKQPVGLLIGILCCFCCFHPEDLGKVFLILIFSNFDFFFLVSASGDSKEETRQRTIASEWRAERPLWWRQLLAHHQTGTKGRLGWFGLTNRSLQQHQ